MNYKELIERLRKQNQSFAAYNIQELPSVLEDASTAIETLLAERDAAVEMLRGQCYACKHNAGWHNIGKCGTCMHETARLPKKEERQADNWEWSGPAPDRKTEEEEK